MPPQSLLPLHELAPMHLPLRRRLKRRPSACRRRRSARPRRWRWRRRTCGQVSCSAPWGLSQSRWAALAPNSNRAPFTARSQLRARNRRVPAGSVIPAKAGIQSRSLSACRPWIPAFAGMTPIAAHSQKTKLVMAGLVPAIHDSNLGTGENSWMTGTSTGHDRRGRDSVPPPKGGNCRPALRACRMMPPPRPSKGRSREALRRRDEVRRPRAVSQDGTRAAAELPPGPLGVPARSWLKARSAHSMRDGPD